MTSEQETQSVVPIAPDSSDIQGGAPIQVEALNSIVREFGHVLRSEESEKTKRAQITADSQSLFLRYWVILITLMLTIAVVALFLGKDQVAENIIYSVVGFIGGFGYGKIAQSGKS